MLLLISLTIFIVPLHASVWENLTANIAVAEYRPITDATLSDEAKLLENTMEYMKLVMFLGADKKLDLVVFPEDTLRDNRKTAVEVELGTTCDGTTQCAEPLESLGAVAHLYRTYIVVNLVEKEKCEAKNQSDNCQNYGYRFYNTDVAFDRNGTIINKYRKYNLFGEYDMDQPEEPDQVIIKTDFGVNFGIFTCFDIMFKSPAQDLLSQDIQGVIFPTMWFSELPFLTALQTQQMFSYAHDITFISAGANDARLGSGGTAIYRGIKGTAVDTIVAEGGTKVLLYESVNGTVAPFHPEDVDILAKEMDNFYLKRDHSVDSYNSSVLDTTNPFTTTQVCYSGDSEENQLCCNFILRMSTTAPEENLNYYTYHLVAYSGVRSFSGVYNGGIEVCAILACTNASLSSCGQRFANYSNVQWPTTFEEITVAAAFEKNDNKTQFPNSLLSSVRPIDATKTTWGSREVQQNGTTMVEWTFSVKELQNRVLTFGIFGRNFGQDSPPAVVGDGKGGAGQVEGVAYMVMLACSVFLLCLK